MPLNDKPNILHIQDDSGKIILQRLRTPALRSLKNLCGWLAGCSPVIAAWYIAGRFLSGGAVEEWNHDFAKMSLFVCAPFLVLLLVCLFRVFNNDIFIFDLENNKFFKNGELIGTMKSIKAIKLKAVFALRQVPHFSLCASVTNHEGLDIDVEIASTPHVVDYFDYMRVPMGRAFENNDMNCLVQDAAKTKSADMVSELIQTQEYLMCRLNLTA